jgi:hypothetical protein
MSEPQTRPYSMESILAEAAAEGADAYARLAETAPPGMVPLVLVPVEVFGTDDCCQHGHEEGDCPSKGYGLSDGVSAWSDCNRATGQIYRVDEFSNYRYREPGETVVVYVPADQVEFFAKKFGTR